MGDRASFLSLIVRSRGWAQTLNVGKKRQVFYHCAHHWPVLKEICNRSVLLQCYDFSVTRHECDLNLLTSKIPKWGLPFLKLQNWPKYLWNWANSILSFACLFFCVLNKDLTTWLTEASLPTPVSCPPLGGSHMPTAWCTRPSKSFNLSIFKHTLVSFQATKIANPSLKSFKYGESSHPHVRSHKYH